MASVSGKGYSGSFGDAGTDRLILYGVLGLVAYFMLSAGKGLSSALGNLGQTAANLTGAASTVSGALANATNSTVTGLQQGGSSLHDYIFNNTPNAVPIPGFGPDDGSGYMTAPPLEPPQMVPAPDWSGGAFGGGTAGPGGATGGW